MNLLNKKNIKIIAIIIIAILLICALCLIINLRKNKSTFSPIESYSNNINTDITNSLEVSSDEIVENIVVEDNVVDNHSNEELKPTNTTNNKQSTTEPKYYIKINYGANVVTIYTKDANGNYTTPIKAMVCSTGTATPKSGVYKINYKYRWLALFGNVYGQYCTRIVGNILFHSVPYLQNGNPASLEYWEYDKLGTSASAGCIRLKVDDAIWIYNNCSSGTKVEFYSDSNPGPLGKPSAPKISQYDEPYKNWDPTDPNNSNPWKNGSPNNNNTNNNNDDEQQSNNETIENDTTVDTPNNTVIDNIVDDNEKNNDVVEDTNTSIKNNVSNNTTSIESTTINSTVISNDI